MALTPVELTQTLKGLVEQRKAYQNHPEADKEHGGTAFDIVSHWARTDAEQQQVIEAVRQSLELAWCWFDGFARATA